MPSSRALRLAFVWIAVALLGVCACAGGERRAPAARPSLSGAKAPTFRLVALTDLAGSLEPCGCQSRPLGGLDRIAAKLEALRADGVPTVFVAAGDLLYGELPAGVSEDEALAQKVLEAETLVEVLGRLGLLAFAPGPRDFAYGQAQLAQLAHGARMRPLPAALHEAGGRVGVEPWLVPAGDRKLGLIGASLATAASGAPEPEVEQAVRATLQASVDALRSKGAEIVLLLLSSDARTGRRLAGALRGVDLLLSGGAEEPLASPPARAGSTLLLRAARHGAGLLVVDVHASTDDAAPLSDASEWTRKEQREALATRVQDLQARLRAWQADPSTDRAGLAEQRKRLRRMQEELASLEGSAALAGRAIVARFEELGPEAARDPETRAQMARHDARVNAHNRQALAHLLPPKAADGEPVYVGSAACGQCHGAAHAWWSKTPHGHAYDTLVARHKQYNLSCVGCHVTGYAKPGGSSVVHNEGLEHVGCESCHGPGSKHVQDPDADDGAMLRSPGAELCLQCHTPEHSDLFEFATYRARLLVPGHGLPKSEGPREPPP